MDKTVTFMVTLTLLLGGAFVAFPESASAQTAGSLKGRICSADWGDEPRPLTDGGAPARGCYGSGLPGATVRLQRAASNGAAFDGSQTTDESGSFSFPELAQGNYTVTVTRAGFESHSGKVTVSGGTGYEASLRGQELQITGRVADASGAAVPRATVYLSGASYQELRPGTDGSFSATLRAGFYHISANAPGFQQMSTRMLLDGATSLELSLERVPPQTSSLTGVVTDQQGRPVPDARITVSQHGYCCYAEDMDAPEPRPAVAPSSPAPASSGGSGGSAGSADMATSIAYPEPYPYYGENWTTTDANGRYSINVFAGGLSLRAEKDGYLSSWLEVRVAENERKTQDLKLEKLPDKTARVVGRVTDAAGNGLQYVSISIESPLWGLHECSGEWEGCKITLRPDGSFEATVTPGYSIIRVYHEHWRSCVETQDANGNYRRDCGPEYFSWTSTQSLTANGTTRIDAKLAQRPGPDATMSGYLVDTTTNKAISGARITFSHQLGHGYGWATTDRDGSYKVRVHSGVHYVSVYADGYLPWEGTMEVRSGAQKSFDVLLTPGEPRYGGCCYGIAYADGAERAGADGVAGAPAPPSAPSAAGGLGDQDAGRSSSNAAAFEDLGGGLGPYDPNARSQLEEEGEGAPGLGLMAALAAVGAALVLRRRR